MVMIKKKKAKAFVDIKNRVGPIPISLAISVISFSPHIGRCPSSSQILNFSYFGLLLPSCGIVLVGCMLSI